MANGNSNIQDANWSKILNHLHGMLITGDSRPVKANALLNLIRHQLILLKYIYTETYTEDILSNEIINY